MRKITKVLSIILSVALVLSVVVPARTVALAATSGKCGDNVTYTLDSEGTLIISGTGDMTEYSGYSSIFYNNTSIKKIIIKDGVTSIGSYAFEYCTNLESVEIQSSVQKIGMGVFRYCSSLTNIEIPSGVTYIAFDTFYRCSNLTSVKIPDSVTSIETSAFSWCGSLSSIKIPDKVTSIKMHAFNMCTSLTSIEIPKSVTSIGDYAFYGDTITVYYESEEWLKTMKDNYGGTLTWVKKVPTSIELITDKTEHICEYGNLDLTGYNLKVTYNSGSNEVLPLTSDMLYGLSKTKLGEQVVTITYCGLSTTFTIINKKVVVDSGSCGENITWILDNDGILSISGTGPMYDYSSAASNLSPFIGSKEIKKIVINDGVTTVGDMAFNSCENLTSVRLPEGLVSIGYRSFGYCISLKDTEINIPDTVTTMKTSAFACCYSFEHFTIPKGVKEIDQYEFDRCENLVSIVIPEGVTSIGRAAFNKCTNLTSIEIPSSVIKIESNAFKEVTATVYYESDEWLAKMKDNYSGALTWAKKHIHNWKEIVLADDSNLKSKATYGSPAQYWKVCEEDGEISTTECFEYGEPLLKTGTCGDNVTYTLDKDGLLTISGTGDMSNYDSNVSPFNSNNSIIKVIIKDGVTSIGRGAFKYCNSLTSIEIPSSVTSIGYYAFSSCNSLTSIEIPSSVTSIGCFAFDGCSCLTSIEIPFVGNTLDGSWDTHFGFIFGSSSSSNNADYVPSSLKEVKITGSSSIANYAFYGCSGLTSIEIPSSVTSIGYYAFYGCSGLTSIEIPSSVTSIGSNAFYGCSGLTSIEIPSSVTSIGWGAFEYCNNLTSIEIPSSVTSIGSDTFYRCSGLTSIEIPSSVKSIGGGAFEYCNNLTSIEIPSSVTSIGDYAFSSCSSLTSIEIPSSVTSIGYYAFYGCSSLTSIEIPFIGNTLNGTSNTHFGYIFGANSYSCNSNYVPSNLKKVIITGSSIIDEYAFYGCSNLTSIEIPSSVTSIGWSAFKYCNNLTSIEIPFIGNTLNGTSNTHFGYIFGATDYSESSRIPSTLKEVKIIGSSSIDEYAFYLCISLTSIEIPSGIENIGSNAFCGCSRLTSIEIPEGVTSVGNYAFSSCSRLTSIDIPSSVTSIGNSAFYRCSSLTSIEIPEGVKSIGNYVFSSCSRLTSIEIPNSVISIGDNAFSSCNSLTSLEIPNSVISIGNYAFSSCSSLTSIGIPSSVTSIGYDAFYKVNATIYCDSKTWIESMQGNYGGTLTWVVKEHNHSFQEDWISDETNHWHECALCTVKTDAAAHIFDNGCDSICNLCGYTRTILHKWQKSVLANDSNLKAAATTESAAQYWKVCLVCGEISTTEYFEYGDPIFSGKCGDNVSYVLDSEGTLTISGTGEMNDYVYYKTPFFYNTSIKKILIESGVTRLANNAFYNCTSVTSIKIPSSVTSIGNSAFYGCSSLTSIEIPEGVTSIDKYAFSSCNRLTSIDIPNSVTSIGNSAFYGCSSLTSIEIPEGVTNIGESVFSNCSNLISISLPSSVTSIGYYAFNGCSSLTSIEIPNSVTSIAGYAFYWCWRLTSIEIPSSVTSIGVNAFYDVTATVYYDSDEWLSTMKGNYGGTLTWVLYKADFDTAGVNVGSSLALQTNIIVTENIEHPKMKYTINGKEVVKDGTLKDGKWSFELDGITPEFMASTIKMEVMDGSNVVAENDYCIKDYCNTLYSSTAEELGMSETKKEKLDVFLADMLEYGAMTQKFLGQTSGDFANDLSWVAEKKTSSFSAPASERSTTIGVRDSYDKISSAGLVLNDSVVTYFNLKVTNATHVEIYDGTNTKTIQLGSNMNGGTTTVFADKLSATQLDTKYTVTLKENDTILHQITYSVNSYIASKCNGEDTNLSNLVKAIYKYGLSAKDYQGYGSKKEGVLFPADEDFPSEVNR